VRLPFPVHLGVEVPARVRVVVRAVLASPSASAVVLRRGVLRCRPSGWALVSRPWALEFSGGVLLRVWLLWPVAPRLVWCRPGFRPSLLGGAVASE